MNKFIATGNLTKDVEIHYLNTGLACANFDLAISRKFKNSNGNIENEVCYIECKTFGKNAEIASQFLHKGSRVMIDGRLYFDSFKNKKGDTIHKHSVIVEKLEFFNNKDTQTQNNQDQAYNTQNQIQKQNNTQQNLFAQNNTQQNIPQAPNNNVLHKQTASHSQAYHNAMTYDLQDINF